MEFESGDQRIDRSQRDDLARFERVFRAHYEGLCTFAWQYVRSMAEAEDIVQDAFMGLWHRRASWDDSRSLKSYLYTAVRNRALNALEHANVVRAAQVAMGPPDVALTETPHDLLTERELMEVVDRIIDGLPQRRREVFLLHRRHGFTYEEIANMLGISERTVETHISRTLEEFRGRIPDMIAGR